MYENKNQKLISQSDFLKRLFKNFCLFILAVSTCLFLGMLGYHFWGELNWVDSFLESCMILGGMGPVNDLKGDTVKIFAGCYAIFSGVAFLSGVTLLISPFWHRAIHKFHLADEEEEDAEENDAGKKKSKKKNN
jgi:hypothetical protein